MMQKTSTNSQLFKRLGIRFILAVSLVLLIIYGLPKFIYLFYPFILAFLLAAIANPLVDRINSWLNRLNIDSKSSRNFITFILTIFILSIISFFFYYIFSTLIREIIGLATNIQSNWSEIVVDFERLQLWVTSKIDGLPAEVIEMIDHFVESILEFIRNISRNLLNITVTTTRSIISSTGTFFLDLLTFFLSLYFMMSDYNHIKAFIKKRVDKRLINTAALLRDSTLVAVGGYIKTQFILSFIAFLFMFIAFVLYGQEYALTIAILLAIIDLIPLLGTIAALVPWGIVEYILGDPSKGVFLVLLGVGFFLFRRVTEPKIMGTQTGLHPLFALIGIYTGIQISGLWGALLGPLVIVVILSVIRSGLLDNTMLDLKELYYRTITAMRRE